jgi:hypothetical protein
MMVLIGSLSRQVNVGLCDVVRLTSHVCVLGVLLLLVVVVFVLALVGGAASGVACCCE